MSTTFVPSTEPLSKRDRAMLNRAVEVAKQSTCKQKHGAIIYKSGRVLAVGVNSTRNEHPTMEIDKTEYTFHAEISAMRAAHLVHEFDGTTLYVARINRRGNAVFSGPCSDCMHSIIAAGIKRVVFTV